MSGRWLAARDDARPDATQRAVGPQRAEYGRPALRPDAEPLPGAGDAARGAARGAGADAAGAAIRPPHGGGGFDRHAPEPRRPGPDDRHEPLQRQPHPQQMGKRRPHRHRPQENHPPESPRTGRPGRRHPPPRPNAHEIIANWFTLSLFLPCSPAPLLPRPSLHYCKEPPPLFRYPVTIANPIYRDALMGRVETGEMEDS
ncbi:protein of unknown function [Candidatus Promineifilum breve]|uniref:Uncharacterized protein n=1 Tax=Candidatus Promineifilum breve TaxID=1806508 RepID=A0A160SZ58_9CHLR|nr:protein of unknown function [Candidatus Promineifilum breve]